MPLCMEISDVRSFCSDRWLRRCRCWLASQLLGQGWQVQGLRRSISRLPEGVRGVAGDLFDAQRPATWPTGSLDYVVYCAAATDHDEAGYRAAYVDGLRHVLSWLKESGQQPRRLLFVSSSSVYVQQHGEWVDETSTTEAESYSGRLMLEAEQLALDSGIAASRVRLTGIYGPGREWLLTQVRRGYQVAVEPPLYGNRIHADDAAGLLAFLLGRDRVGCRGQRAPYRQQALQQCPCAGSGLGAALSQLS